MSEFIVIQVGQCGNQIGSAFWPLCLNEYGISLKKERLTNSGKNKRPLEHLQAFHSFFSIPEKASNLNFSSISELEAANIKARAICIDMEDSVVSRFKKGPLRNIFDECLLLTNYPGSGNNWAEGYFTHGQEYITKIEELIRKTAEKCSQLHGFLLLFSLGGGTGSGLGSAILSMLEDSFPHVHRLVSCVYPAGNEDVVTAPYNVALASNILADSADCVFPIDNKALLDICNRLRHVKDLETSKFMAKPFQDMNSIIVQMLLNLTSGSRFPGSLNVDMGEIATNMVPFPGLHYICSSISPLGGLMRKNDFFPSIWSRENQLLKLDPLSGFMMSSLLIGRGAVSLSDMRQNVERFQKKIRTVPWSTDAIKIGLCSVAPATCSSSALGLFNTTAMSEIFQDVAVKFQKLYKRKAHTHHYLEVEGFEQSFFESSLENLQFVIEEYNKVQNTKPISFPRIAVL